MLLNAYYNYFEKVCFYGLKPLRFRCYTIICVFQYLKSKMTKDFILSDDSDEEDKPTNDEQCTNGEQNVSQFRMCSCSTNVEQCTNGEQNVSLECVLVRVINLNLPCMYVLGGEMEKQQLDKDLSHLI